MCLNKKNKKNFEHLFNFVILYINQILLIIKKMINNDVIYSFLMWIKIVKFDLINEKNDLKNLFILDDKLVNRTWTSWCVYIDELTCRKIFLIFDPYEHEPRRAPESRSCLSHEHEQNLGPCPDPDEQTGIYIGEQMIKW